ncbi:MAG: class I SAM-dependent RNA methyltransferase [Propionibacteriaceae bacterium]|nr:class I SAM-dependent RNA methyltransferase [Propionibacteriaceae bacterium]
MAEADTTKQRIGPIELTGVASGGLAVGRLDGRVVFVRGGIPGERVWIRVTDTSHSSYWRAEVVSVDVPSPDRVVPPCPIAGECGGCDLQHLSGEAQLEWKRQVVADQLKRLAGLTWKGEVQRVEPQLGWRTRMRYHRGEEGLGLRAARSHRVVPLPDQGCLLAHPGGRGAELSSRRDTVQVTVADDTVALDGVPADVIQAVQGRSYTVSSTGFWQVHPSAASTLVAEVLTALMPRPGQVALDLYCGVGLFAGFLSDAGAHVVGVEGDAKAVGHARRNVPRAVFHCGDVARVLSRIKPQADLVVLDPPRSGAGRRAVTAIASTGPSRIAYVSCDPATLARDLAMFGEHGYQTKQLRAFDLFPMTHHVECVALLGPRPG